ncbi:hypothetical protein NHQ30_001218 [Ciborinia camelliae]|nr:hypothetical protein NHQ30_001218 [Ciborinia camelliae]
MANPLQFQLDVIKGGQASLALFSNLLNACAEDRIQPVVIQSLEEFGSWVMVDTDRISIGQDSLTRDTPVALKIVTLLIGMPKAISTILIREILRLGGTLRTYNAFPDLICDFVDNIKGYEMNLESESPIQIFNEIVSAISEEFIKQNIRLDNLFDASDVQKLAKIIYEALESLKDEDIRHLTFEGSDSGARLAALFVWLRRKEVNVYIADIKQHEHVADDWKQKNESRGQYEVVSRWERAMDGEEIHYEDQTE